MPMPWSSIGECVPGGDLAALEDRHALARDGALLHHEGGEPLLGPVAP